MSAYKNLMDSYGQFKKKKSLKNLADLYNNAFSHPRISVWKLFRFAKNLMTGKYEKLQEQNQSNRKDLEE